MNELIVFRPGDVDIPFMAAFVQQGSDILFVLIPLAAVATSVWIQNKRVQDVHGPLTTFLQCWCRVAMDIGLVIGIGGSAIGVAAMTIGMSERFDAAVSVALLTILWGGILVGLGYFLKKLNIPIEVTVNRRGALICAVVFLAVVGTNMVQTKLTAIWSYAPWSSQALLPYFFLFALCGVFMRFNGKPWIISITDANLLATLGGLAMGVMYWFTAGGGYENGRSAVYVCALVLIWGSIVYVLAYIISLYCGEHERGNYQTKTWHLSEAAVFFFFLLYAPVGATEWAREYYDRAAQHVINKAQQQQINELKAQIENLRETAAVQ